MSKSKKEIPELDGNNLFIDDVETYREFLQFKKIKLNRAKSLEEEDDFSLEEPVEVKKKRHKNAKSENSDEATVNSDRNGEEDAHRLSSEREIKIRPTKKEKLDGKEDQLLDLALLQPAAHEPLEVESKVSVAVEGILPEHSEPKVPKDREVSPQPRHFSENTGYSRDRERDYHRPRDYERGIRDVPRERPRYPPPRYRSRSPDRRRRGRSRSPRRRSPIRPGRYERPRYSPPRSKRSRTPPRTVAPRSLTDWEGGSMGPAWGQVTLTPAPIQASETAEMKLAVEKEAQQQKQAFTQQRNEYLLKRDALVDEVINLKNQCKELAITNPPGYEKYLVDNTKLQEELAVKIKSVDNVLDMLTGLIGDNLPLPADQTAQYSPIKVYKEKTRSRSKSRSSEERTHSPQRKRSRSESKRIDDSPEPRRNRSVSKKVEDSPEPRRSRVEVKREESPEARRPRKEAKRLDDSPEPRRKKEKEVKSEVAYEKKIKKEDVKPPSVSESKGKQQWNYVFFDPELHWCRPCRSFPQTAKEYLTHMHTPEHRQVIQDRKLTELPWHEDGIHKEVILRDELLTKRVPIKGLQFFVAAPAWYCKLCRCWMGDLHCASLHLKSSEHSENYLNFLLKNPTWEETWLGEREKAQENIVSEKERELIDQRRKEAEELARQRLIAAEMVIPLSFPVPPPAIPVSQAPKEKKEKKKKNVKRGKNKKKKKRHSSESSSSSSDSDSSSSSSSSSSDGKQRRKKKTQKATKVLKVAPPEKSKWEKEEDDKRSKRKSKWMDPEEAGAGRDPSPEMSTHALMEAKKIGMQVRYYRNDDRPHFYRPPSPYKSPYEPKKTEKESIPLPQSKESKREKSSSRKSKAPATVAPAPKPPVKPFDPASPPSMKTAILPKPQKPSKEDDSASEGESSFDRQVTAGKKNILPTKTKFAFIGRMPFARRKPEIVLDRKVQDVPTPDPTPPPPPVISHKKEEPVETVVPVLTNKTRIEVAKNILTRAHVNFLSRNSPRKPLDPVSMEEEMELVGPESPPLPPTPKLPASVPSLPPEVTKNLGKKTMAVSLPKEFRDTLSLIYPEELPVVEKPATPAKSIPLPQEKKVSRFTNQPTKIVPPPPTVWTPPPLPAIRNASPPTPLQPPLPPSFSVVTKSQKNEPAAPPPPSIYMDIPHPPAIATPPAPSIQVPEAPPPPAMPVSKPKRYDIFDVEDMDEMALLGIEKGDMAAQHF